MHLWLAMCWMALGAEPTDASEVTAWVELLDAAAGVTESRALPDIPAWLTSPSGRADDVPELDLDGAEPRFIAIALLWMGASRQLDHIVVAESYLDDGRDAGSFPTVRIGQRVAPSYPVSWRRLTVSAAALQALANLTGERFPTRAHYLEWRAQRGALADDPRVWLHALSTGSDRSGLDALDPVLALRVRALTQSRLGLSESEFRSTWDAHVGTARTVAVLTGAETWPEHNEPGRYVQFARWAVYSLDPAQLDALWNAASLPAGSRADLAVAWSRAHPSAGPDRIESLLGDPQVPQEPLLAELVGVHRASHGATVVQRVDPNDEREMIAVLGALAQVGPQARPLLAALLARASPRHSTIVGAAIDAADAVGARVDLPLREDIHRTLRKSSPRDAIDPSQAAREDCLQRLRDAV